MRTGGKVCTVIAVAVVLILTAIAVQYQLPLATGFAVPEDARFVVIYSTGEGNSNEKSEIKYLDDRGKILDVNIIDGVTKDEAFSMDKKSQSYNLFTHDAIYYDGGEIKKIANEEMEEVYKFASDDGADEVYNSGYIDKTGVFYKYVPHGFAYAQEDLGYFDLIVLYNDEKVINRRVYEGASVTADPETGIIYAIQNESGPLVGYQAISSDISGESAGAYEGVLDMSEFYDRHVRGEEVVTLYKAAVHNGSIYLVIDVGEEDAKTFLAEIAISGDKLLYKDDYPIDLAPDETLSHDVPVITEGNTIEYYSLINPNEIISFNVEDKTFDYEPWKYTITDEKDSIVRVIDNVIYVMEVDHDKGFITFNRMNDSKVGEELLRISIPEARIHGDYWISDFYVIEEELNNGHIEITEMSIDWENSYHEYKVKNVSDKTLYFMGLELFAYDENGDDGFPISSLDDDRVIKLEQGEESEAICLEDRKEDFAWQTVLMQGYMYKKNGENQCSNFYVAFERNGDETDTSVGKSETKELFDSLLYK